MASIPANELAQEILDSCLLRGTWPPRALDALVDRALDEQDPFLARSATRALFGIVVEGLSDLFEPSLCDVYARLFSHVISRVLPEYNSADLILRYGRIRQVRRFRGGEVRRVFVLSRVTLGADVAVTSLILAAAKQRFPDAEIIFVAPEKNAEMFAADPGVSPVTVMYGRGSSLRDRLAAAAELRVAIDEPSAIVIDPDSRLTQLGLMPVGDDSRYFFFESRAFGGTLDASLTDLTSEWLAEVFDVEHTIPYLAPAPLEKVADVTVSLGVGENAKKRIDHEFEYRIISELLSLNRSVLLDRGAEGQERDRVDALALGLSHPANLLLHDGTYASFAGHILRSGLYVGYDSAGQHVAAAGGVPLVSIFTGHPCDRMLARWRPNTATAHVVTVNDDNRQTALKRTLQAIAAAAEERATARERSQTAP